MASNTAPHFYVVGAVLTDFDGSSDIEIDPATDLALRPLRCACR